MRGVSRTIVHAWTQVRSGGIGSSSANGSRRRRLWFGLPAAVLAAVAALGVFAMSSGATATCTLFWKGATSNQWNLAGNWVTPTGTTSTHAPGVADFVCMSDPTTNGITPSNTSVQLASGVSATITGINWPQTATVSPALEVDGTLKLGDSTAANASTLYSVNDISGGILASNTGAETVSIGSLTASGTLEGPGTITIGNGSTLAGTSLGVSGATSTVAHLIVAGTTSLTAASNIYFYDGSQLEIASGGTLNLGDSSYLANQDAKAGNQLVDDAGGTVAYTAGTTGATASIGVVTSGTGTFSAGGGGTLTLAAGAPGAGADAGTFTAASGSTLVLQGTRKAATGMTISGAGLVDDQGTEVFTGTQTITDNGTLQFDANLQGPATTTISGTGKLILNGAMLGVYAAADAEHLIVKTATASIPASTTVYLTDGSVLENGSALTQGDSSNVYNYDANAANAAVNDSGASWSYTGSTNTQNAYIQVPFRNAGTATAGAATFQIQSGGASTADTGSFTAASGATLDLNGTRTEGSGSAMAGTGLIDIQGTTTFNSGSTVTNTGTFQVDGTLIVPSGNTLTVPNLTANGTLEGPGTLTDSGGATLNNPTLGAYTVAGTQIHLTLQGTSQLTSTAALNNGSVLENAGTLTQADNSNVYNYDGNASNAAVNDASASWSYPGSAATQTAYIQAPFQNAGAVTVTKGTWQIQSGGTSTADTGSFTAASGATLGLNGTRTEGSGSAMAGAGVIDIQGTTTFNSGSTVTNTGTFQVDGTLIVPTGNTLTLPNLTVSGTLEGPGNLTVSGSATLTSSNPSLGAYNNSGTQIHVTLKGTSHINGTAYLNSGSVLENAGTLTQGDNSNVANYDGNTANTAVNDSGASWSYTGSTTTSIAYIQTLLLNEGAMAVNEGTWQISQGGTSTPDTGSFTAGTGTTLQLFGNRTEGPGSAMAGTGTVDLEGGATTTFNSGSTVTNTGTFQVDGTLAVASGNTLTVPNLTANGTLEGPGNLTDSGPATLTNPTLGVYGTSGTQTHLTLQGTTQIAGTVYLTNGSVLENDGTLTQADNSNVYSYDGNTSNTAVNDSGGSWSYAGSTNTANAYVQAPLTNNGTLTSSKGILNLPDLTNDASTGVLTGGVFNAAGGVLVLPYAVTTNAAKVSMAASPSGTPIQSSGANALGSLATNSGQLDLKTALTDSAALSNTGTVTLEKGTLATPSYTQSGGTTTVLGGASPAAILQAGGGSGTVAISAGTLTGTGQIKGKLTGGGTITPAGTIAGPMTVTSTFDNNAGTLTIPVSGATTAGTDYGQLSATGAATVNGTLAISTASGYTPPDGTAYTLVQGSSLSGTFGSVTGATLPDRKYVISYTPTSVVATVHVFPVVSGISPSQGPAAGGPANGVTITGSHFTGATGVSFGGTTATAYTVVDDSHITATPPAGSGIVDVTVAGTYGTSPTSSADQYTYVPAPTVTSLNPTSGPAGGGTQVTISGSHFTGATSVSFGSTAATAFTVNNDGQITATSPAGSGTVDVTVTTVGGTSAISQPADQFTYQSGGLPSVTGVNPNAGPLAGHTSVTISGTNLAGATKVTFGTVAALSFTNNPDGTITAVSPARSTTGSVDVLVTTPTGTSAASSADRFTYDAVPSVSKITPGLVALGTSQPVTVSGTAFVPGSTQVKWGASATPVAPTSVASNGTSLTFTAPASSTAGSVDVFVITPGGTSKVSANDVFAYGAPTFTSFSPTSGITGSSVLIKGSGFYPGITVTFGSLVAKATLVTTTSTIPAGTQMKVVVPNGDPGPSTITVKDPLGTVDSSSFATPQYTPTMSITSMTGIHTTPTGGPAGPVGSTVTINGFGFTAGSVVKFGGVVATIVTQSASQLVVTVPTGAKTNYVTVTNPPSNPPVGTVTSAVKFTVTAT